MRGKILALMVLLVCMTSVLAFAQDTIPADSVLDIDEWQVLKDLASKDPFEKKNQFTINFKNYREGLDYYHPLPKGKVISPFGGNRHHAGTDIKTKPNDTIYAAFPGKVDMSGVYYAYGNTVVIHHANGLETLYSHQSKNLVKKGDWVQAGQPIGLTGRTGRATTEHLHFETRVKGKAFDTSKIFDHVTHKIKSKIMVFTKNGKNVKITEE